MRVVGVIDLRGGRAVHASGGVRALYEPVARAGRVQVDGDPVALARFYQDVYGLDDLYVADLDAITGGDLQRHALSRLAVTGRSMWLDAGVASADAAQTALQAGASRVIIGLETLPDYGVLERICTELGASRVVLSLDLREGRLACRPGTPFAGDSVEEVATQAWRAGITTMIVLDLARVGGGAGPAVREIGRVRDAVPDAEIYAGGGVRSVNDLRALHSSGVTGALVASALHDGRLTPADLHSIRLGHSGPFMR